MFSALTVISSLLVSSVLAGPHMMEKDFYVASGASDDCGTVPNEVMKGNPMNMACSADNVDMEEVCVCVRSPPLAMMMAQQMEVEMEGVNPDTNFKLVCGKCRDPCSLRFMPDEPPMPDMGKKIMQLVSGLVGSILGNEEEEGQQY